MNETLSNPKSEWDDFFDDTEWDDPEDSTITYDDLKNVPFAGEQTETLAPQYIIPPKPPRETTPDLQSEIISLEEVMTDLSDPRYELLGHGTKTELIPQILQEGIRAGGDGRDTDIDSNFYALNHELESLQNTLNHWQHNDAKQIVLFRPPLKYKLASPSQHSKSTYGVFFHDSTEPGVGYYEPEYIYGWYDASSGLVSKNSNYHGNLDDPSDVAYLEQVYQDTKSSYLQSIPEADRADYELANNIYYQYEP